MSRLRSPFLAVLTAVAVLTPVSMLLASPAQAQVVPAPGDIVVSRIGDGSGALGSAATPVFLDEYSPSGALVRTTPLPTVVSGAQRRLTMSGSATSEGALALSGDGRYVTLAGYDAAVGTASVASTSGTAANRVVGRLAADATVDTSTASGALLGGNNARGAVSDDGSRFWMVGGNGILYFPSLSSPSPTTIGTMNSRVPLVAGGQLYASSGSTATLGLNAVGSGLPTSTAANTLVTGTNTTSPYGAVFLDRDGAPGLDTLYLADDTTAIGLTKFAMVGGSWVKQGTSYSGSGGLRGLTGSVVGADAVLWAVTSTGSLVKLNDAAAFNAEPSVTAGTPITAGTNRVFRGVAFAPQAPAVTPTAITNQPQDQTITGGSTATLTVAATGANLTYQWYSGATTKWCDLSVVHHPRPHGHDVVLRAGHRRQRDRRQPDRRDHGDVGGEHDADHLGQHR